MKTGLQISWNNKGDSWIRFRSSYGFWTKFIYISVN